MKASIIDNRTKISPKLKFKTQEDVYILLAMARKKDGTHKKNISSSDKRNPKYVMRRVLKNHSEFYPSVDYMIEESRRRWEKFRIYISVNPRSIHKAWFNMQIEVNNILKANDPRFVDYIKDFSIEMKSLLHSPKSKSRAEYFLLDIDTKEDYSNPALELLVPTPNGHHGLIKPCNPKELHLPSYIELKTDAMILVYSNT